MSVFLFVLFPFPWWGEWGLIESVCHSAYCCPALNGEICQSNYHVQAYKAVDSTDKVEMLLFW